MISFENTISALITMIGSMWFISFAPPTHVPAHGHVFIFLKCSFRTYFWPYPQCCRNSEFKMMQSIPTAYELKNYLYKQNVWLWHRLDLETRETLKYWQWRKTRKSDDKVNFFATKGRRPRSSELFMMKIVLTLTLAGGLYPDHWPYNFNLQSYWRLLIGLDERHKTK